MDFGAALRSNAVQPGSEVMGFDLTGGKSMTAPVDIAKPYDMEPVRLRLRPYEDKIAAMVEQAGGLSVTDDASNAQAVEMANQAKKIDTAIETVRKALVHDPNEYVKGVNNLAKSFQGKLQGIAASMRGKIGSYVQRQEMERRKAEEAARKAQEELQAKIDAEAKTSNVEPVQIAAPVVPKPATIVRTEAGSASTRKVWKHEIIDEAAVPRRYLMVDESKIRQAVKQGVREIPGVRIFEHTEIAFRG
jgi:hypothetical protein